MEHYVVYKVDPHKAPYPHPGGQALVPDADPASEWAKMRKWAEEVPSRLNPPNVSEKPGGISDTDDVEPFVVEGGT